MFVVSSLVFDFVFLHFFSLVFGVWFLFLENPFLMLCFQACFGFMVFWFGVRSGVWGLGFRVGGEGLRIWGLARSLPLSHSYSISTSLIPSLPH